MKELKGISASSGIAVGKAFFLNNQKNITIPQIKIEDSEKPTGWNRFTNSLNYIISSLKDKNNSSNKQLEQITQTYLLMLQDEVFINEIKNKYFNDSFNIEYIINLVTMDYANKLLSSNNEYLSERASDVTDIFTRVIYHMLGFTYNDFSNIPKESIIISHNIQPSEAIEILKQDISGIILNEGGINSHLAILARSYGIPAIIGLDLSELIDKEDSNNSKLIIDGQNGIVIYQPDSFTLTEYLNKQKKELRQKEILSKYVDKEAISKDGKLFKIYSNIGSLEDVEGVIKNGADGIGLLRTEFLFMKAKDNNELLNEDIQFDIYSQILKKMGNKPVVIRTLDAGGDKVLSFTEIDNNTENNPLLGNRAIRFCLSHLDVFKTQLKALYRASIYGNLKIMFPLISTVEQFQQTLLIITEVKKELSDKNISYSDNVPIGIMIETPSAAICADLLAPLCDFFSIGTNDLTQYTLAVDRENYSVSNLFNELNPAVIRLINNTFKSAEKNHIPVSVCGEFASRPQGIEILGGIGIRSLSMTSSNICSAKEYLSKISISEIQNKITTEYNYQ